MNSEQTETKEHDNADHYVRKWQSVHSMYSTLNNVFNDVVYYEVTLITEGEMRIGWTTKRKDTENSLVGDTDQSISIDGYNRCIWHDDEKALSFNKNIPKWKSGSVVGCLINLKTRMFTFNLENEEKSTEPHQIHCPESDTFFFSSFPYFAAFSLSTHQQISVNLASNPFVLLQSAKTTEEEMAKIEGLSEEVRVCVIDGKRGRQRCQT